MPPKTDKKSWGDGGFFGNRELGALALLVLTPLLVFPFWFLCADGRFKGDFALLDREFGGFATQTGAGRAFLNELWGAAHPGDMYAWKIILCYMAFELVLQRWMPGKEFYAEGARTVSGRVPKYVANGVQSYVFTIACLFALRYDWAQGKNQWFVGFNPADVYDKMGHLLSCSNVLALALCTFLTFKGLHFPSTRESGTNGNLIIDFFWGTDLYPNILGWDVKQFTNCRFGMMFWQVGILCYAMKQYDLDGYLDSAMFVSVLLQTVYIAKFFWWETGYFQSMDIQHDRAGYYICWGCMVWVPSVYTMHTLFLVRNPQHLSPEFAAFYTIMGVFCIWCNYDCDRQRQEFRLTGGRVKIWGREPTFIEAKYETKDNGSRTSLLLADGWWGLSRHFHYIPEIMASVFWCVPAQYGSTLYLGCLPTGVMPYFYPFYLTLLLLDRAWRDDKRCADKYKEYWVEYCRLVPAKIVPGAGHFGL